jgi:hypothetical protein
MELTSSQKYWTTHHITEGRNLNGDSFKIHTDEACSDVSHKAQWNDLHILCICISKNNLTHKLIPTTKNKTVPITSSNQLLSNDISSKHQSWGPVHNGLPCSSPQPCTDVHVLSSLLQSEASVTQMTVWLTLLEHNALTSKNCTAHTIYVFNTILVTDGTYQLVFVMERSRVYCDIEISS